MLKTTMTCSAALLACAVSFSAQAGLLSSASTSVTGFTYKLVDLDLSDGITPWIQFTNNYLLIGVNDNTNINLQSPATDAFTAPSLTITGNGLSASSSAGAFSTSAQLDSQTVQNLQMPPTDITVYSGAAAAQTTFGTGVNNEVGYPEPLDGEFSWILSPHTALVIEGNAQVSSQVDLTQLAQGSLLQGVQNNQYGLRINSYAVVIAELTADATFSSVTGNFLPQLEDYAQVSVQTGQALDRDGIVVSPDEVLSDSLDQFFSVQVANQSTESRGGKFQLLNGSQHDLNFTSPLVPEVPQVPGIPEPGTYALMGLGLGLMAWRVRAHKA